MKIKLFILLSLLITLVSCGSPGIATPAPTPEAIHIYYPSSLQPWSDRLSSCASENPHIAVFFTQSSSAELKLNTGEIELSIGEYSPGEANIYPFQLGWEQVVVIVNQANPISKLSSDTIREIYKGQKITWDDHLSQLIQVWVLPQSESVRQYFDEALNISLPYSPNALLAPDPSAMLEAVAEDVNAIGYLPQAYITYSGSLDTSRVKSIQLEPSAQQDLRIPVIATSLGEPTANVRNLLVCLQNANPG